jgi:nicotinamidase/pyrazinamidase
VIVYGLAADYCVKATALDAIAAGYRVELILDLCRGVSPETTASALEEMEAKGVNIISN